MFEQKKDMETALLYHLFGGNISDSVGNIEIFYDYFGGDIPIELKYSGKLYRIFQTKDKKTFNKMLKKGVSVFDNQKYYSCSKSLDAIDVVKSKTSKKRYKYYVIFSIDVDYDDVLFDINKLLDYLKMDSKFRDEEEVLVLSDKKPKFGVSDIISYGEF